MNLNLFLLFILFFILGCEPHTREPKLFDYLCTPPQMADVENQTMFCRIQTGYRSSGCYLAAMDRNCKKKDGIK